jgi:hypothetical protein
MRLIVEIEKHAQCGIVAKVSTLNQEQQISVETKNLIQHDRVLCGSLDGLAHYLGQKIRDIYSYHGEK